MYKSLDYNNCYGLYVCIIHWKYQHIAYSMLIFIMDAHMKHVHGCSFTCMSSSDSSTPYTTLTADAIARYTAPGNNFNLQWTKHYFGYIPRAQYALAFLLIHGVVQFTMHITSRCTPHRTPNQYINRHTNHIYICHRCSPFRTHQLYRNADHGRLPRTVCIQQLPKM